MKKPYVVKFEPEQLAIAKQLRIKIAEICRLALDKEITNKTGVCATCGIQSSPPRK